MTLHDIELHVTSLSNVTSNDNFGYRLFFYSSDQTMPFVSLAESDSEYDSVSKLNRDGVFRVNIGVERDTFKTLFPEKKTEWDYTELNKFLPHPHYAAQNFICVLNPTGSNEDRVIQYIDEAYSLAKKRFERKHNG